MHYDDFPYGGRAVPASRIERLELEARLLGLNPQPASAARVLELGCAEGANLVPMAFHLPEARFVGVDASRVHIERATEARDRLGLDNLELLHTDILELPADLGSFDYVICHGVLSWVDERARAKIWAILRDHLADHGVAYLSYNSGPGWALRRELRKALLEQIAGIDDAGARVERMRGLLGMLARSPLAETAYGALLAEEAQGIAAHRDAYLVHEYLTDEHHVFDFRDIVETADAHELAMLTDVGRAPVERGIEEQIHGTLAQVARDPIGAEELTDLVLGRTFRASLLCHRAALAADVDRAAAARSVGLEGWFAAPLRAESARPSLEEDANEVFLTRTGAKIAARNPLLKAALLEVGRSWPRGVRFTDVLRRAEVLLELRRVKKPDEDTPEQDREALLSDLLRLHALDHLELRLQDPPVAATPGAMPRTSALTRFEAERGRFVTNPLHQVVELDDVARHLVRKLDGSRDVEELTELMLAFVREHGIALHDEEGKPREGAALAVALRDNIEQQILGLTVNALIEDPGG